jgi:hypothetical protein
MAPARAASIGAWQARRLIHVMNRRSMVRVGHEDLAAWIPDAHRGARRAP